jgi:hypothetical protein
LVDAAKAAGIQHFVWPTLDSSELKVPHWETKAAVNEYLKVSGVPRTSYVSHSSLDCGLHVHAGTDLLLSVYLRLYTAFFIQNFTTFFSFKRNDAGEVVFDALLKTDGELPCISAYDVGGWALVAFKDPNEWTSMLSLTTYHHFTNPTIHATLTFS